MANNLILTVGTVGVNGAIATFGSVGTGRVGDGVVDVVIDVTGTDGVDTYTIAGNSTDYTLTYDEDTGIVATSTLLSTVEFNLNNHERVVFDDTAIAYDLVDGKAGEVFTVLAAAFGVTDVCVLLPPLALQEMPFKEQKLW